MTSRPNTVSIVLRLATLLFVPLSFAAAMPAAATPQLGATVTGSAADTMVATQDAVEMRGSDDAFHSLFLGWNREESVGQQTMAVPSAKPINMATFTSGFGVRSDPFRGSAAMHAGIDLAAPQGTAVYATADGIVDKAEWFGGYGNCIELDHGKNVQTRFGHLSRILVHQGQRVHRGDLIALVGSTGRSTGAHLHYEVRIDGHAVNPVPFLQSSDYIVAMRQRAAHIAVGGPEDID